MLILAYQYVFMYRQYVNMGLYQIFKFIVFWYLIIKIRRRKNTNMKDKWPFYHELDCQVEINYLPLLDKIDELNISDYRFKKIYGIERFCLERIRDESNITVATLARFASIFHITDANELISLVMIKDDTE